MHPAQKHAIVTMIQAVEVQLGAIKTMLGVDAAPDAPTTAPQSPSIPKAPELAYMTDDEEKAIEAEIEQTRVDALAEVDLIQKQWAAQRQAIEEAEPLL